MLADFSETLVAELAFKLYGEAAAKGYAKAEYELARHYGGAGGGKVDLEQSFAWLQKAGRGKFVLQVARVSGS